MSWVNPHTFEHGEYPTAANMNKYSTGLQHIYDTLAGKKHMPAAKVRQYASAASDTHFQSVTTSNSYCVTTHLWRWLFYGGSGTLTNLAGTERTSLPDTTGGGTNIFDLDSISWLTYGQVVQVLGVTWAFEDYEP